jgi:hypothetical protein
LIDKYINIQQELLNNNKQSKNVIAREFIDELRNKYMESITIKDEENE